MNKITKIISGSAIGLSAGLCLPAFSQRPSAVVNEKRDSDTVIELPPLNDDDSEIIIDEEEKQYLVKYEGLDGKLFNDFESAQDSLVKSEEGKYKITDEYINEEDYLKHITKNIKSETYYEYLGEKYYNTHFNSYFNNFDVIDAYFFNGSNYTISQLSELVTKNINQYVKTKSYTILKHPKIGVREIVDWIDYGFETVPVYGTNYYSLVNTYYDSNYVLPEIELSKYKGNDKDYTYIAIDNRYLWNFINQMNSSDKCESMYVRFKLSTGSLRTCNKWEMVTTHTTYTYSLNGYSDQTESINELKTNYLNWAMNVSREISYDKTRNIFYQGNYEEYKSYVASNDVKTKYISIDFNLESTNYNELQQVIETYFINNKETIMEHYEIVLHNGDVIKGKTKIGAWEILRDSLTIKEVKVEL